MDLNGDLCPSSKGIVWAISLIGGSPSGMA